MLAAGCRLLTQKLATPTACKHLPRSRPRVLRKHFQHALSILQARQEEVELPHQPAWLLINRICLQIFVVSSEKVKSNNYSTLYTLMTGKKGSLAARIVLRAPQQLQPVAYMLMHLLLVLVATLTSVRARSFCCACARHGKQSAARTRQRISDGGSFCQRFRIACSLTANACHLG